MKPIVRSNLIAGMIALLGSTQLLGDISGSRILKGLGAASMISPCPRVFCSAPVRGENGGQIETFSSQFSLVYRVRGVERSISLDPHTGKSLKGPYNRRNVYGAGLSYAPCLPRELVDQILSYGLGSDTRLRTELEIPTDAQNLTLVITSSAGNSLRHWKYPILSIQSSSAQ